MFQLACMLKTRVVLLYLWLYGTKSDCSMVTGFNFDFSCTDYRSYAQEVQFNSVYNSFVYDKLHSLPLLTSTLLSNYFDLKKAVTFDLK